MRKSLLSCAALAAVLALAGCSSSPGPEAPTTAAPGTSAKPAAEPSEEAVEPTPQIPVVPVGKPAEFEATNEEGEKTTFRVVADSARYVTAEEIEAMSDPENGQLVVLTLTVKNVGKHVGRFMPYGAVYWENDEIAGQDATTLDTVEGHDLDAEYKPGQAVTGGLVLDIGEKGGRVTYSDGPESGAFAVELPKK
ncbi:hypothetical protein ACH4OV_25130 [Streptomyces diastaticus]|uniref:hypothetical protein n=1 Tax=Streptomyces diastaticus TaxID=1956 RepID=UPI0037A6F0C8